MTTHSRRKCAANHGTRRLAPWLAACALLCASAVHAAPTPEAAASAASAAPAASAPEAAASGSKPGDPKTPLDKGVMALKVEPGNLQFDKERVGSSRLETLTVTGGLGSSATLTDIHAGGDFSVSPGKCDLGPAGSCAIFVTFKPSKAGISHSAVVVTEGGTTRVISKLTGEGTTRCEEDAMLACHGITSLAPVIVMVLIYALGLMVVRWNMIAVPSRRLLWAEIEAVAARVANLQASNASDKGLDRIAALLDLAKAQAPVDAFWGMPFDTLLWCRGQETAGWNLVHEAEEQLVHYVSAADLRAALERSETQLRQVAGPVSMGIAESIRAALAQCPVTCDAAARAVLKEAQAYLLQFEHWRQNEFAQLGTTPANGVDPVTPALLALAQNISTVLASSTQSLKNQLASIDVTSTSISVELRVLVTHLADIIVPQATQLSSQIDAALQAPAGATMGSLSSVFAAASNNLCKAAADACDRVDGALNARASHSLGRWRALYAEALNAIYDRRDIDYSTLLSWHNKTTWLTACGLLLILALAATLENDVLFLLGATGGLLSRLSRSLYRQNVPTDYGASWTTLFLSPVVGAIAGWAGVLLVLLAINLGVLGPLFASITWDNSFNTLSFALALVFGFSERAFDTILSGLEGKVVSQATPATPAAAHPTISTATLKDAKVGQPYTETLAGTGGKAPFSFTVSSGAVPDGVSLSKAGQLSGSPKTAGTAKFTIQAADSAGVATAPKDFSITVLP